MNRMKMPIIHHVNYFRFFCNIQKVWRCSPVTASYTTTVDVIDSFTDDLIKRHKNAMKINPLSVSNFSVQHITNGETTNDLSKLEEEELSSTILQLIAKNKDKQIEQMVLNCHNIRKIISYTTLKTLFSHYSMAGKPEMVVILKKYCAKVIPNLYRRNGEFSHYLATAQCMKGNSEKGLSILRDCYMKFDNLRSYYIAIFRELIQDSVMNRSEASLVVFKKYVLEFSEKWEEHYPMVCFWHICWSSSWYSDHMLSNELLDASETLQEIVKEKATAFSISILKQEYNEDAVIRLLQILLKYHTMTEYAKVLQVLFSYKLRNRDLRGCTEIVRNCEVLGVSLPSDQQGQYIKMLIDGKVVKPKPSPAKPTFKDFKLKF